MRICKLFIHLTISLLIYLLLMGCSTTSSLKKMSQSDPITLSFSPKVGDTHLTRYVTVSHTKTYEDQQIISEQIEGVDFDVESKVVAINKKKDTVRVKTKTVNKVGNVSMHDLAFPELEEIISFTYDSKYRVKDVKGWSDTSIFYVPPMSLPEKKVSVGDTWSMSKNWLGQKNKIPLRIDIVTIFKNLYQCPGKVTCAELEISGNVNLNAKLSGLSQFTSRIMGRALVSVADGTILWSRVNSEEELKTKKSTLKIRSCIASHLQNTGVSVESFKCKMNDDLTVELLN